MFSRLSCIFLACITLLASTAWADVDRIEILERTPFAGGKTFGNVGAYERIRGRLTLTADPNAPENAGIVDLKLAPRDAQGRVVYSADFMMLKPVDPTRSNSRLLYEVNNRGSINMLSTFNNGRGASASEVEQAGTGFLFEQGYTLLSSGWTWDVAPGDGRLRADLPTAGDGGRIITGRVNGEVTVTSPTDSAKHVGLMALGYPPANPDEAEATLTVRTTALGARNVLPRSQWRFGRKENGVIFYDPAWITLDGGFKPGAIYTLTYTAREPRVVGLGLAAIRDAVSFFRYNKADRVGAPNPLLEPKGDLPKWALAYGHSQSARLLNTMVYSGFTADGRGRPVFDGIYAGMAGAGRGSFNYRFAQSSRHFSPDVELDYPTDWFPMASGASTDAVTKVTASTLDKAQAAGFVPKIFIVNGASEYWARSASLAHITTDGSEDISLDARTRVFLMAGAMHNPNRGGERGSYAACHNPLDYRPLARALLMQLDAWATINREPAPSAVPQLTNSSAGSIKQYADAFPKIPAVRLPTQLLEPPRLDFGPRFSSEGIADNVPPKAGQTFAVRVPMPDENGLDTAGLRLPELVAPLGTYVGWNIQNAATGAPERLARWEGSFFPFARNDSERMAVDDPRKSISERYPTREAYIEAYSAAAVALAEKELVLALDVNPMIERAGQFYDRLMAHNPEDETCGYLAASRPPATVPAQ